MTLFIQPNSILVLNTLNKIFKAYHDLDGFVAYLLIKEVYNLILFDVF